MKNDQGEDVSTREIKKILSFRVTRGNAAPNLIALFALVNNNALWVKATEHELGT